MDKIHCVQCRDTGYVTYTDANCTTTCYCDCQAAEAAWHRDEELAWQEEYPRNTDDD